MPLCLYIVLSSVITGAAVVFFIFAECAASYSIFFFESQFVVDVVGVFVTILLEHVMVISDEVPRSVLASQPNGLSPPVSPPAYFSGMTLNLPCIPYLDGIDCHACGVGGVMARMQLRRDLRMKESHFAGESSVSLLLAGGVH